MKDIFRNIITFGGHNKVLTAETEFQEVREQLRNLDREQSVKREFVNLKLDEITDLKIEAVNTVKLIKKITSQISIKEREFIEENISHEEYSLEDIENNLTISEDLINLGKSTFKGVAISGLSTGASWGTVASLGFASTGTAISSLSGAAATNATLAWFGGGSLATGGLGMAGGTAVLGGIVAIPAVLITGLIQYKSSLKKVKELKEKKNEVLENISLIYQNITKLNAIEDRCEEYIKSLNKAIEVFQVTFEKTYKRIYKYGIISKWYKKFMHKIFKKKMFDEDDLLEISHLGKCTSDIMKIIDFKII